jgi:hypothetical protein
MYCLQPLSEPAQCAWLSELTVDPEGHLAEYRMIVSKYPAFKAFLAQIAERTDQRTARAVWLRIFMQMKIEGHYSSIQTYQELERLAWLENGFRVRQAPPDGDPVVHYLSELERALRGY